MPAQRKCKGKDRKNCDRFMSNLHSDGHLLCSSCRGQPRIGHAECESWWEDQWQRYLSRYNTYQDRKDKKSLASSDSRSSMSMPNLTIQVTPKTFAVRNKDGDQTLWGNAPTPQASRPVDNIIPDSPRTNALRAEFTSQIVENQMEIHHKDFAASLSSTIELQLQLQGLSGL